MLVVYGVGVGGKIMGDILGRIVEKLVFEGFFLDVKIFFYFLYLSVIFDFKEK